MTADKPEAGRTCEPWCGTERDEPGCIDYCTNECGRAERALNPACDEDAIAPCDEHEVYGCPRCDCDGSLSPAPRPVEQDREGNPRIYPCAACGTMRSKPEGGTTFTVCDECWDKEHPKSRPVERCSCEESVALRKALEVIAAPFATDIADVRGIARRALALGGENDNG